MRAFNFLILMVLWLSSVSLNIYKNSLSDARPYDVILLVSDILTGVIPSVLRCTDFVVFGDIHVNKSLHVLNSYVYLTVIGLAGAEGRIELYFPLWILYMISSMWAHSVFAKLKDIRYWYIGSIGIAITTGSFLLLYGFQVYGLQNVIMGMILWAGGSLMYLSVHVIKRDTQYIVPI
jgi:hypothetical protein